MKNQLLSKALLLTTALVLTALCIYAAFAERPVKQEPADGEPGSVLMLPAEIGVVSFATPTPAPTPAPVLPEHAVDVSVDDTAVFAVASEAQAEAVLNAYLANRMLTENGEVFVSAEIDCDVRIGPAGGKIPCLSARDALALLESEPSLLPVRVVTEQRVYGAGSAPGASASSDAALASGSRILTQLGSAAYTRTVTRLTYRAGVLAETSEPVTATLFDMRQTLVKNGTLSLAAPETAPKKFTGVAGKTLAYTLKKPVSGSIVSYFGTHTGGVMQNGVDFETKAGAAVTAPAEGVVLFCRERGEYGFVIDIDHGDGVVSRITQVADCQVELHQRVFAGDRIATVAAPETESGKNLLHYELLIDGVPYDPIQYWD